MALQSNAALLDELMGKNRNVAPGASIREARFDDEDTCKYFLVSFCPHDLFVNTRADLGPCLKSHDEEMKKQYEKSSRFGKLGYEEDFERYLRSLLSDVERKIRRGMERLKLTQSADGEAPPMKTPIQMKQERLAALKEQVNTLIKEAEHLGEEGNIDEAQLKLEESEKIKSECKYLENQLEIAMHNNADQKQMEVCNVCGSFLIVNDAQSRIEEHISGKQHVGYAKLRQALEDIRKKRIEELEKREKEREKERERDRDREKKSGSERDRRHGGSDRDRDRDRERDRNRDRDRDRERDRTTRERSRDRDRDRDSSKRSSNGGSLTPSSSSRDRDRDRDRHHSSNSRHGSTTSSSSARKRTSRSRSRSRDRSSKLMKKDSKIEQEADEFLKMVDDLTSKKDDQSPEKKERREKKKKEKNDEEKEEGEEDDSSDESDSTENNHKQNGNNNNNGNGRQRDEDTDDGEIRGG